MLFFVARVICESAMQNSTLVVLTNRSNLDDEIFGQIEHCADSFGQTPVQARDREHLRELLALTSGGVIFTTIQEFVPAKGEKSADAHPPVPSQPRTCGPMPFR
jgi:type I restriction enzyme R subunit